MSSGDEEEGWLGEGVEGVCGAWDTEEAQASLAPHVQAYLARNGPTTNCCGFTIPIAFERAAPGTWWNPRFDSDILEQQYRCSAFQQIRLRFRFALGYILIFSLSWFIYFVTLGMDGVIVQWPFLCTIFAGVLGAVATLLFITFTKYYRRYTLRLSLALAIALSVLSLSLVALTAATSPYTGQASVQKADVSRVGHFTMCIEILLIIYTVTPLPLYVCVLVGVVYSVVFEVLTAATVRQEWGENVEWGGVAVRILLQVGVHILGTHVYLMTFVRMRGTFMKVGQSLLVRRQLEMERQLKQKMIHSVMPPKLAASLMDATGLDTDGNLGSRGSNPRPSDIKSLFRPFNMSSMDNVSILFADIVGFTRMSSNKSAEELVSILNDLFERFDELCKMYGCEKISTLGDCYYCVSGCPEPNPAHAKCCVEMGLGMIDAIREFDAERGEGVNMRVGVHTGTVLCGIVGTRRFKFDVWSNDVTLANKMESTGEPGRVHVTEETSRFLSGCYVLEEGMDVCGHKTYFIEGRHSEQRLTPSQPVDVTLIISPATSVRSASPPPVAVSHAPHLLSPNQPQMRVKANSLPSILDSEVETDKKQAFPRRLDNLTSKSPTSVGGYNKYANKLMSWKVPKFLRKHSDTPAVTTVQDTVKSSLEKDDSSERERSKSNGYQQVPVVSGGDHQCQGSVRATWTSQDERWSDRELIDIRAYLSQSRNNITPFTRTTSYRSHCRPSNLEMPVSRASSSTITHTQRGEQPSRARRLISPSPAALARLRDDVSICPSVDSRKDSGIPSTSRRSSIQQQIYALNQSALVASQDMQQHRVSGYYTSSQSSVDDVTTGVPRASPPHQPPSLHKLRKQSDLQLIRCVQENASSDGSYFVQPPLSPLTLFFRSAEMERQYRSTAHRSDDREQSPPTLATSRFNTALDILVSCIVSVLMGASLLVLYTDRRRRAGCLVGFGALQATAAAACAYRHYVKWQPRDVRNNRCERMFKKVSNWYPWHVSGSVLVSLPILAVLLDFSCAATTEPILAGVHPYYVYLLCLGIVHFCNFTQMNWLVKNCFVTIYAAVFLVLVALHCTDRTGGPINGTSYISPAFTLTTYRLNSTDISKNVSKATVVDTPKFIITPHTGHDAHLRELNLDIALLLLLVWFLNREFEISYRLSFHSDVVADRDRSRVQIMRNQADWLLHNIIPRHVAEQLKCTAKYSENHKYVGVIFASIVNFNEMYDESYLRGKEYLRVLNELIADFDELLERPEFACVDKIKTIGSTFMAASGLNPEHRRGTQHLNALINFAMAMQEVLASFNRDLLEFELILRIGYNCGDVTAGVIGTTKLYYDIWGDAVNIASRMDSTGVPGRLQLGEACLSALEPRYTFEPRGSVYVKGKDNMNVYLLIGKR